MGWTNKIRDTPTGFIQIWSLWRHCCCRYGWYPLGVSLIVSAACLLDLYSSGSCDFIQVNIGFVPSNIGWNQSTANVGLFLYQAGEGDGDSLVETVGDGCRRYSEDFETQFINGDRTWQVARIMGMIAAISGLTVSVSGSDMY